MRPDGTLIVTDFELGMDVHDFDRGALVEQAVDVGAGAFVPFLWNGSAGVLGDGVVELLDVATGDRSVSPVVTPEGEFFFPFLPGPNGFFGIMFETSDVARWEDGQIVERIRVASEDGVEPLRVSLSPGRFAQVNQRQDGTIEALLVNSNPGELEVLLTVEVEGDALAHPTPDDGLYVVLPERGTFQTYDKSGSVTDQLEIGLWNLYSAATDESSGKLAFAGAGSIGPIATGTAIVDPATGDMQIVPDASLVANLTFARNGELLVIVSLDGSVRLWDVEQRANAAVILNGSIGDQGAPLWYDETTDSIWIQSSSRLERLPLSPERWTERACEIVGRDFTQEEWDRFVPGDQPLQSSCP